MSERSCSRWMAVCVDMLDHPVVGMDIPPPPPADPSRHAQSPMTAWISLLAAAAWREKSVPHKGKVVTLKRGDFLAGRTYWAARWNWGEQAVRSFFARLAQNEMISISNQSKGHLSNTATICNYDEYQSPTKNERPEQKPEPNQRSTSAQPVPNQTVPEYQREEERAVQSREREKEAALPVDLKVLSERVTAACNGALASEAVAPGLASMATPLRWIESGCDLERDVLPALTVAGKKYHGKQIRSWEYFTAMVGEAKSRREAGMPASPAISAARNRKPTLAEQEAFIRDRQRAVFETYGIDTGGFFTPGDSAEIERRRKAGNGLPPMFNQAQKAEPAQTVPGGVDR